ncbi:MULTISPECIES: hypothetical protein [Shewanella]|uniref:Uncharacterized protein n=1 Tax=Shewanella algae TaxID=38313 RepID=A0A7T8EDK1_9GAMM|nr:hypothetical protein [Shewanella algae]MBO2553326.1 hypothetical protein [Shewanella algae]MCE9780448.1 hypothetical protein [Shewanella algae]MCE9828031.1 hypothetical protein [Shewanella algae]QQO84459.1 hypothetical protein D7032_15175 [Shewanella algae]QTE89571.1 hypothetical protein JKK33_14430 [Shewanella algae]
MPKEWIDVADTAVKIGLGALITGVFTYLGVKTSHRSEKQKFMLEHKTKLLEQISDDVETYFRSFDSYIAKIAGITKHQKNNNEEGNDFSVKQKKSINERDQALVEGWAYQKSAISRLRLVKANVAVKALGKFNSLEKELRDRIVFDKEVPTYDEVVDLRKRVAVQKREVHKALADFYDGLQTNNKDTQY